MTLEELKNRVMFQTGNDAADLGDYLPHVAEYLNEGYDRLLNAFCREHVSAHGAFPPLKHDRSEPQLPHWAHAALADWASWRIYMGGSAGRQSRGLMFRASYDECEKRLRLEGEGRGFFNIPL